MAAKKKTTAPAEATEVKATETVAAAETTAPAEEKKPAAAKKPAAEKKTAAPKKAEVSENVFVEYLGAQITSNDLIAKAKELSGVKSPKVVNVYVKPEDNKVYFVVDNNAGCFDLV